MQLIEHIHFVHLLVLAVLFLLVYLEYPVALAVQSHLAVLEDPQHPVNLAVPVDLFLQLVLEGLLVLLLLVVLVDPLDLSHQLNQFHLVALVGL